MTGGKSKNDIQQVQCLDNPCDTAQCPNIPDAICVPSNCGHCSAHFFNASGHNVTSSCSTYFQLENDCSYLIYNRFMSS